MARRANEGLRRWLLELLLAEPHVARSAGSNIASAGQWNRVVKLSAAWSVLLPLRRRLRELAISPGPDAQKMLDQLGHQYSARSIRVAFRAVRLLDALVEAGIGAIAIKGVGLMGNLYGGAAGRRVNDFDIIVEEERLEHVVEICMSLGFAPLVPVEMSEWRKYLEQRVYSAHDFLIMVDQDKVEVDIHWRIATKEPERFSSHAMIQRAEKVELLGHTMHVAAPIDAMLVTAHHVLRENFSPYPGVRDMCDLAAWWGVFPERWDLDELVVRARATFLATPLFALWHLLARLDPESRAADGVSRLSMELSTRDVSAAMQLGELFELQIREGAVNELVLLAPGNLRPSRIRRFLSSRLGARSHQSFQPLMRIVEGPERSMWLRLGGILRDVVRLGPRRIRLYRTLSRERAIHQSSLDEGNH